MIGRSRVRLPSARRRRRTPEEMVAWIWRGGGLLILGVLAAGMTAFPGESLTLLEPARELAGAVWGSGLRGVALTRDAAGAASGGLRRLFASARETDVLRNRLQAAERDAVLKDEDRRELIRLRRLLGLKEDAGLSTRGARVIGGDPGSGFTSLVLDAGADDGLRAGECVIAPAGAVGRLLSVGADTSVALWLGDPRSRVSAFVQRSRVAGVLAGTGRSCELRYLAAGDDVKVGDRVLTADRGSIFPRGVLIGTVTGVRREGLLLTAEVAPAVNVTRLEEVLVITRLALPQP